MPYIKRNIQDRIANDTKYMINNVSGKIYKELISHHESGDIVNEGTLINKQFLDVYEDSFEQLGDTIDCGFLG